MKAILYFVSSGRTRDAHKEAATKIAEATGKKVVFRNSTAAGRTDEKPEPNEGVAGLVPTTYEGFTRYDDSGKIAGKSAPLVVPDGPVNSLGLPDDGSGHPDNREDLKTALTSEGIEFHTSAPTEKLVSLYRAHWLPEPDDAE